MAAASLVRLGRHDEAIAELAAAESTVDSRPAWAHLVAKRAFTASVAGRTRDGLEAVMPLVDSGDPAELAEAIDAVPCMLALDGRAQDGLDLLERAVRMGDPAGADVDSYLPLPRRVLTIQRGLCMMYAGCLAEAADSAEQGLRAAEEYGSAYLLAGWLNMLGRVQLDQGRPAAAVHTLGRVIAETPEASGGAQRALAYNALIEAYALLGQPHQARRYLELLLRAPGNVLWYPRGLAELARGHLAFSEGDMAGALALFAESYHRAADHAATIALAAAHAVGRFGHPRLGLELAGRLPTVQGPLAGLRIAHLAALAGRDAGGLLDVAGRLQDLGAYLYAAEACGAATRQASRLGQPRLATTARRLGRLALAGVDGAVTPDLTALSATTGAADLTRREREIAILAAKGTPSRTIAATLTLSVRTVDNHLLRIYTKLGVAGRQDLTHAIGVTN
jgi:DNA-binding CsgD family transcriptional regulator